VLDLKQAQEWVVTTKLGSSDKRPGTGAGAPAPVLRFYASEMLMSTFVLTAAFYGIFSVNKWSFSIFLTLQGVSPGLLDCALECMAIAAAHSMQDKRSVEGTRCNALWSSASHMLSVS